MRDSSVTNPYLLASIISTQNMISPAKAKEVKADAMDLISKVFGFCGFLCAAGFVTLNTTYCLREFQGLSLSQLPYICGGICTVLLLALSCLLFAGTLEIDRRFLHSKRHPLRWLTGCLAAHLAALALLVFLPFTQSGTHKIIFAVSATAIGTLGLILLTASLWRVPRSVS